jgi:membrane protein DedA with SNARE-associated domain
MPEELVYYVSNYGYLAIFILVFLQEVGAPNPIPNEFVLLFSGYLVFSNTFHFPFILPLIIMADLLAASILYIVFYYFGNFILNKNHRWVPISPETIERQSRRIQERGMSGIAVGRLTPFVRGYVAVISGLLHVNPRRYGFIVIITSSMWATLYITTGYFLGPYWDYVVPRLYLFKDFLLGVLAIVLFAYVLNFFVIRHKKRKIID